MVKEFEGLIDLINLSLYDKEIDSKKLEEYEWEAVLEEARVHNCWAIVFTAVKKIQSEYNCIDKDLYKKWENGTFELATKQCVKNYELEHVIEIFENNTIKPVIFKGVVVAKLYPEYLLRSSSDADILIDEDDYELAEKLLLDDGYHFEKESSKDTVPVFIKDNILKLEVHTCLWEDYAGEQIKLLESLSITDKDTRYRFYGCDVECDTLGITEHLIYMIYHMVKHFIPSGIGIRHLIDLTVYVNAHFEKIDFRKLGYCLKKLNFTEVTYSFFKIAIQYLGMDKRILQGRSSDITEKDLFLLDDIRDAGVFGNRTTDRVKSLDIIKQTYYENGTNKPVSKTKVLLNTMFPSADSLSDRYVDAKKHKVLLPVAWTQRALYHLKQKSINKDEPNLFKKAELVEKRMNMLNEFGLNNDNDNSTDRV